MDSKYLSFCPALQKMVESGKTLNQKGETVKIEAVSTIGNMRIIREMLLKNNFTETLEIGLAYGGSALTFLATMKETSSGEFHHTAIDPFQSKTWGGCSLKLIEDEGFSGNFTHHEDYSSAVLPDLVKQDKRYDLIYVDGSHLFEEVFLDFYYSAQLLKLDGTVFFDDCTDPHVRKVIQFIRKNYKEYLSEIDYREFEGQRKPLKKKIGNYLGIRQLCGFRKKATPPRPWDTPFFKF